MKKNITLLTACFLIAPFFAFTSLTVSADAGLDGFVRVKSYDSTTFSDVLPDYWFYDNMK